MSSLLSTLSEEETKEFNEQLKKERAQELKKRVAFKNKRVGLVFVK
jgi:hypothetical protein